MTQSTPALRLERVTKLYGDFRAVNDLSFEVPPGTICGFLGPNGAGKTTSIRIILSILEPTSGRVEVLGHGSAMEVRDRIGYLPEEKGLYKKMKAWSIVSYFGRLKGMTRQTAKDRALALLERYGLKEFSQHKCEALSKGMQQKVQVLASIVHEPDFVILDEPFSGLDPVNQGVLEELIHDLAAKGKTILFSTHTMQHAERLCQRIILLSRGRKVFDGTVPEAKRAIPMRVLISTESDIAPLRALPVVASVEPAPSSDGVPGWEIRLRENADPQQILQACFQRGIQLRRFDQSDPSLHEVFIRLVGDEAREAVMR